MRPINYFLVPHWILTEDEVLRTELRQLVIKRERGLDNYLSLVKEEGSRGYAIVAENMDEFIGWAMALNHQSPPKLYHIGVFVKPEYRNKGVGKQLLKNLVEIEPEAKFYYKPWSPEAVGLYRAWAKDPRFFAQG